MTSINESEEFYADPNQPPMIIGVPKVICKKHGNHEHSFVSIIPMFEGAWCMLCMIEALDRIGIERVEKDNG